MRESEQQRELAAWAARLGSFQPEPSRLDRDRVMYLAGRASVANEQTAARRPLSRWGWRSACGIVTTVAACLLIALIVQSGDRTSAPVALQGTSDPSVSDQDATQETQLSPEPAAVEASPVYWPGTETHETPSDRLPRSGRAAEVERLLAQVAEDRFFEPDWEREFPPGSFVPPDELVDPIRPRSHLEQSRLLYEELMSTGEPSAEGPSRHPSSGA